MAKFKIGDKVVATQTNPKSLEYGYNNNMEEFVKGGKIGTIEGIDDSLIVVDGWSYAPREITLARVAASVKTKAPKAEKPLPVSNRPAYAVVKNKEVLGMFELRADARAAKKSVGGKKAGVAIVAYVPVQEIR